MDNIFSFIEKNNSISKSSKYNFKQLIFNSCDVFLREFLLDNWSKLEIHFKHSLSDNELNKMYDYFFLSECERMKIYIHDIKTEEKRKKFANIVQNIQKYLKKYNIHKINEFVLNNFDCLKEEMKNNWLKKMIFWSFWGTKQFDTFFEKIKNDNYYQWFIINNFSRIKNDFINNSNWCEYFFNFERLQKYLNNGMIINDWFLNFVVNFKDHNSIIIKEQYKHFENFLREKLDFYHSKIKNIDDTSSWLENKIILSNILNYFRKTKKEYKLCKQIENDIDEYQDKYLEKYGTKVSFNLSQQNQKMICDAYSNIEQDWYVKILSLTHHKKNDKKFISFFEEIGGDEKNIIDMICDDEEYFFSSKMDHLNIHIKYCVWILREFYLSTKKNDIFFRMLTDLLKECIKLIKDSFNQFSYNDEIKMLLLKDWISKDMSNIIDNKQYLNQKLNFSSSISIVLLIEKFLEILYLCKYPKDKSLPRWYLTLSLLLAKESPIEEIFGKNTIKIIKYIVSDSRGLNIRKN